MDELFLEARKIVGKRYSEDNPNYFYILFSCYALLTKYIDCKDLVEYYILNTNVVIEKDEVEKVLLINMGKEGASLFLENEDYHGVTFDGMNFEEGRVIVSEPYILISSNISNDEVLITLVHEFSHLIKSFFKSYSYNSSNYLKVRCGLAYTETWNDDTIKAQNAVFDEIINTLQTKDMTEKIKNVNLEILNKKEKEFIRTLDFATLDRISGYDEVTSLLEDIWKEEEFKNIFEDDLVLGNISNIKDSFNSFIDSDLFDTLSMALDNYFYLEDEKSKELIISIVNLFRAHINKKLLKKL